MSTKDLIDYLERDGSKIQDHHIDHIIPWKAFKEWGDVDDPFFQAAYVNYRNMQLLSGFENQSKSCKCTKEDFDAYITRFKAETGM